MASRGAIGFLVRVFSALAAFSTGTAAQEPPERVSLRGTLEWTARAGDPALRSTGPIVALEVSPDGRWIASGCSDRVTLWDSATGRAFAVLAERDELWPYGDLLAFVLARDGKTLIGGNNSGVVWIWDPEHPEASRMLAPGHGILRGGIALSSDSSGWSEILDLDVCPRLATVWRSGNFRYTNDIGDQAVTDPRGKWLAGAGWGNRLVVASAADGSVIWCSQPAATGIVALAVSAEGNRLAAATADSIEIRETATWSVVGVVKHEEFGRAPIRSLAFIDNDLLVGDWAGNIRVFSAAGKEVLPQIAAHRGEVVALRAMPDGKRFVSAGADGVVRIWERESGRDLFPPVGHLGAIQDVAADPRGEWFATVAGDDTIRQWDAKTARELRAISAPKARVLAIAPGDDEPWIVSGGSDGTVRIWDSGTGNVVEALEANEWGPIEALGVGPDGRSIASLHMTRYDHRDHHGTVDIEGEVRLWNASEKGESRVLGEISGWVRRAPLGWRERPIVCGHGEGDLDFVSPEDSEYPYWRHGRGDNGYFSFLGVAFASDSSWAVSLSDSGRLAKTDVATRKSVASSRLRGTRTLGSQQPGGRRIAISSDGRQIVALFGDRLWILDAESLAVLDSIRVAGGPTCVAYVGEEVAVGCLDSTVQLYSPRDPPPASAEDLERLLADGFAIQREYETARDVDDAFEFESREAEEERLAAWSLHDDKLRREAEQKQHELRAKWGPAGRRMDRLIERAFDVFERARGIAPEDARVLAGLAWIELVEGRLPAAAGYLDRAFAASPGLASLYPLRAWYRQRTADYVGCLEDLTTAPEESRRLPWIQEVEAKALFSVGRFREASTLYERLVESGAVRFAPSLEESRRYETYWQEEEKIRAEEASRGDLPRVKLVTEAGEIEIELFEDWAPNTVANFLRLAEDGFFEGTALGPSGAQGSLAGGMSDEGHSRRGADFGIWTEAGERFRRHFPGAVSMSDPWPISNGSRFEIALEPAPSRDGRHCVFGRVTSGMDVARRLDGKAAVREAIVLFQRGHPYEPVRIR